MEQEKFKKSRNIFFLAEQLLKENLITHTRYGYQIENSSIYISDSSSCSLLFVKRYLTSDYGYKIFYQDPKTYTLEQIFEELPLKFKEKIIFHFDLG